MRLNLVLFCLGVAASSTTNVCADTAKPLVGGRAPRTAASPIRKPAAHRVKPLAPLPPVPAVVTVTVLPGRPANTFVPARAFGAGVDGHPYGEVAKLYTPANIAAMRSTGLQAISYRLRTELGIECWHWNPAGSWSEPLLKQGYWTSKPTSVKPIMTSYGYRLPRRGTTGDQANNDGYSRLDDGDIKTFWKSNPYLDRHFTGVDNAAHPQWVVIDLGARRAIQEARFAWAAPYAKAYRIEYWAGKNQITGDNDYGLWTLFPQGNITTGRGGSVRVPLADKPVSARFVRIVLLQGSDTALPGSRDLRDRLGFTLREVSLGVTDAAGRFHDVIRHATDRLKQTHFYVSSTDPWHRSSDIDVNTEQPGLDRVFTCGLVGDIPTLVPTGLLFDTPENAVNEMRYLSEKGRFFKRVELGEEPDGQYVDARTYAALYIQFADAIHRVFPDLRLGGPSFQSPETDVIDWPVAPRSHTWLADVLNYLEAHGHRDDFTFCSFEWYPFDDIGKPTAPQLAAVTGMLTDTLARLRDSGLPKGFPLLISEYGYSAFAGQPEADMAGALLNADVVGRFMTMGGETAYLYGFEPTTLEPGSGAENWGNNMILLSDGDRNIKAKAATYYGARMLTQNWALPGGGAHIVHAAASDIQDREGNALVTAYAVYRPDHRWALLLINKDPERAYRVSIKFRRDGALSSLRGPIDTYQFGSKQYRWHPHGELGYPNPDNPPAHSRRVDAVAPETLLPPYSMTVVQGGGPTGE